MIPILMNDACINIHQPLFTVKKNVAFCLYSLISYKCRSYKYFFKTFSCNLITSKEPENYVINFILRMKTSNRVQLCL